MEKKVDWEITLPKRLNRLAMAGQPTQDSEGGGGGLEFPKELDEGYPDAQDAKDILEDLGAVPATLGEAYELCAKELGISTSVLQNNWRSQYLKPSGLHETPWEVAVLLTDLGSQLATNTARKAWVNEGWPAKILQWRKSRNQNQQPVTSAAIVVVEDTAELELSPRQEEMMARILDSNLTTALTPEEKMLYQRLGQQQAFEAAAVTNAAFRTTQAAIADMKRQDLREQVREVTGDKA